MMKISEVRGEVLLAAADADILGKKFREKNLHIEIYPSFYGEVRVTDEMFLSSLNMCTIANLVGEYTIGLAIDAGFIDRENILYIQKIPYAQYAKIFQ
ncbi:MULTISPECIES: DUF424 domain-containing protein [unclassified Thermoplasma]|uniref:DUF424 domain-containing protein n=1 Tax=unclassified Thermoplasma TaxID=2684908 RepID=UPI001F475AE1|nr:MULTISPECIES: DUF424 domain-containing protein [unclassified Thermoplasma]